jgi:membrane protease YdiL (CAAX protease family)
MTNLFKRHPVTMGFVLMFVLTWPLELALAAQSHGLLPFHFPTALELFVGYGFVAAAIIASALADGKSGIIALFRRLLVWRVSWVWYAVALFGPAAFYLAGIGIHALLSGASPDFSQPFITRLVPPSFNLGLAALVFLLYQVFVNGEEFGWRGYALPKLQASHSALAASLIIGVVWALWHVPKYLTAGDPHDLSFWFFALNMIANSVLFTWVFNRTRGSLLLVLLLHAGINTGIVMLPIMPAAIGDTAPLVIAYLLQNIAAIVIVIVEGKNLGHRAH